MKMNTFRSYSLHPVALIALILMSTACGRNDNRKDLADREKQVAAREQQLLIREQQLEAHEQDIRKREQYLDSLQNHSDTLGTINPALVGSWVVTMQCTETNCEGSAIGDTKTENWNISYKENNVIVQAIANKKLIRTYSGQFIENSLRLNAQSVSDSETHMSVILSPHPTTEHLMEGQRIINQGGKCRIVYALKAEKL